MLSVMSNRIVQQLDLWAIFIKSEIITAGQRKKSHKNTQFSFTFFVNAKGLRIYKQINT